MKVVYSSFIIAGLMAQSAFAAECSHITRQEILAAQKSWGEGIVAIGKSSEPKQAAIEHINRLYAYDLGPVLFKPTKASAVQFRDTKEEALSYFVGGQEPEDKGFALAPFTKVRFENHTIATDCDSALAQGNYFFTQTDGKEIKVEYSLGYVKDEKGNLRINLQHSSIPYQVK
jgi:hypothetical protein